MDFDEVFSLTLKLDSLHTMLAITAIEDLEVHQLDVVNAYINGKLEKMIYMEPPETLDLYLDQVLLLQRSIYGLKQSERVWYNNMYLKL